MQSILLLAILSLMLFFPVLGEAATVDPPGFGHDDGDDDDDDGDTPSVDLDVTIRWSRLGGAETVTPLFVKDIHKPIDVTLSLDLIEPFELPTDLDNPIEDLTKIGSPSLELSLIADVPVSFLPDIGPIIRVPFDDPEDGSLGGLRAIYDFEFKNIIISPFAEQLWEVKEGDSTQNYGIELKVMFGASASCLDKIGSVQLPPGTGCFDRIEATVSNRRVNTTPVPIAGSGIYLAVAALVLGSCGWGGRIRRI